jgi:hypothetical protein
VFYFYRREGSTVTCEMRPGASGSGSEIVIMEPGKPVVVEHYETAAALHARWRELQEQFQSEGWWGPTSSS